MKNFSLIIYIFAVGITATLMLGCSNNEQFLSDELENVVTNELQLRSHENYESGTVGLSLTREEAIALRVKQKGTYRITESEAMQTLNRFAESESRSVNIQVKSTSLKKSPTTGKDMYYEVVFESEKGSGFSLVSADERLDDLLCFVENGSLKDSLINPGLQFYLPLLQHYIDEMLNTELEIEALVLSARNKQTTINRNDEYNAVTLRNIPVFDPNTWTYSHQYVLNLGALTTKTVPVKWGQNSPFNVVKDPTGCSTVAATQVMAYWRKNYKSIVTSTFQWNAMIADIYHSTIPVLMADVYSNLYWSFLSIPPFMSDIRSFLISNGYSCGSVESGYSFNVLKSALQKGPTIISGMNTIFNGHFWVVDGVDDRRTQTFEVWTYNYNGKILEYHLLISDYGSDRVQFNWGLHGVDDGWFASGVLTAPYNGNNYHLNVRIISSIQ